MEKKHTPVPIPVGSSQQFASMELERQCPGRVMAHPRPGLQCEKQRTAHVYSMAHLVLASLRNFRFGVLGVGAEWSVPFFV